MSSVASLESTRCLPLPLFFFLWTVQDPLPSIARSKSPSQRYSISGTRSSKQSIASNAQEAFDRNFTALLLWRRERQPQLVRGGGRWDSQRCKATVEAGPVEGGGGRGCYGRHEWEEGDAAVEASTIGAVGGRCSSACVDYWSSGRLRRLVRGGGGRANGLGCSILDDLDHLLLLASPETTQIDESDTGDDLMNST
ncbi:hypothetical protein Scep_023648 [Stephania cephalantha]|uniref:Uncharacterized protein n=1 Tax=Stephania cephalantha TaxID=152367 RepID=A0AAP0F0I0_9MAGN